jgi:hypothetical protein
LPGPPSKRLLPLLFVAVAAAVYFSLAPAWPQDQALRYVLGDAAPAVEELRIRYQPPTAQRPDEGREVTFHYAPGQAPRIVSHEPRLANGPYLLQIEISLADAGPVVVERHLALQGGTTSVDLLPAIRSAARDK